LATATAWGEEVTCAIDANDCNETTATTHGESADERTLSAEADSVAGIFDIGARDQSTVIDKGCNAYWKL
jgi:hypothetical protein